MAENTTVPPMFDGMTRSVAPIQVPEVLGNQGAGKTVYVSFSAEINAHTSESLIAAMASLANQGASEVCLSLSTPGGAVMNGINLYNVLKAMPFKLSTHNVGNMDSIGNAVFQAGEVRYASPHSTFMFHGVSLQFQGAGQLDAKTLREKLGSLEADERRIGSILEHRTDLTEDQIRAFFGDSHTMDAAEAVRLGVVDEIRDLQIPLGSPVVSLVFQR